MNRQIFFAGMSGFDNHEDLLNKHQQLMSTLDAVSDANLRTIVPNLLNFSPQKLRSCEPMRRSVLLPRRLRVSSEPAPSQLRASSESAPSQLGVSSESVEVS